MYEKNGKAYVSEEEYLHNIREIEENDRKNKKRRMKIILITGLVMVILSFMFVVLLDYALMVHQK